VVWALDVTKAPDRCGRCDPTLEWRGGGDVTQAQMTSDYEQARARLLRKRKFRGDVVA
jgi:hypothetical protein